MSAPPDSQPFAVRILDARGVQEVPDALAVEAPLELRLAAGGRQEVLAVTLRTPGADEELALGLLHAEGLIRTAGDIAAFDRPPGADGAPLPHVLVARLTAAELPPLARSDRHGFTTAACGLCGKTSLEALDLQRPVELGPGPDADLALLSACAEKMRSAQPAFHRTGGLHAAALFTATGEILVLREDIGRHNALDKVIGWALAAGRLPLSQTLALVSGRAGYELVLKLLLAGGPILAAVSAPSSLAVATAAAHGMTLVGFLRDGRCNVYVDRDRIRLPVQARA